MPEKGSRKAKGWSSHDIAVHTFADGHVEFRDFTNQAEYALDQLIALALTDVGKYICNNIRALIRTEFPKMTHGRSASKRVFNSYQYWVRKRENDLVVGIKDLQNFPTKYSRQFRSSGERYYDAWYSAGLETGMQGQVKMPRKAYLQNFVYEHVDVIREIESKYLTGINDDNDTVMNNIDRMNSSLEVDEGSIVE